MSDDRDDRTVEDWWLFQRMAAGPREDRVELDRGESPEALAAWAAYRSVHERVDGGDAGALRLVVDLLSLAPNGAGVAAVGAGPLEDLVTQHGDALVGAIEATARRNPGFAACLGSVQVEDGALGPETVNRLARWLPRR